MKKITAILVCLLLVASLAVTAFAATAEMTVTAAKTEIVRGETIQFTISMAELADTKAGGFCLYGEDGSALFDTAVFEYVDGACPVKGTFMANVGVSEGKPTGVFAFMAGQALSGDIFTFNMKVKDDAPFGETKLTVFPSASTSAGAAEVTINTVTLKVVCPAHDNKEEVTKAATCTEAGEKTITCQICGETKTEAIAKLPHTEKTEVTKEATCSAEGEKTFTCQICGETEVEAIAKTEHTLDEGVITTPATTKKEGVKTHTCTVCKEVVTVAIPKLETPATGDNTMILPFVLLMVLSAAGVAVTVIGKKRAVR